MIKYLLLFLISFNVYAEPIDLREYFPDNKISVYNKADGQQSTKYTYTKSNSSFLNLYNTFLSINKSGYHYTWRKEYLKNNVWCASTVGILFMANDKSVTEVGDWLSSTPCNPNVVFGYKTAFSNGQNTGLVWSPVGGLTSNPAISEMWVSRQNAVGTYYQTNGSAASSKTGLIQHFEEYTPKFGRNSEGLWCEGCSKTYTDVIHIVMYHGTKNQNSLQVRCGHLSPIKADGVYYHPFKEYNSYAMELWIAKGVGIIQENTPFIEDASYWGGAFPNCSGGVFSNDNSWTKYIDEQ